MDREKQLINRKSIFDEDVRKYRGSDPLKIRYDYLCSLEKDDCDYARELYMSSLQETLQLFKDDSKYKQDSRFVHLWLRYISVLRNPLEMFNKLYNKCLGTECVDFWISWLQYLFKNGDLVSIEKIFTLALNSGVNPKSDIQTAYDELLKQIGRSLLNGDLVCSKCGSVVQACKLKTKNSDDTHSDAVICWEYNPLKPGESDDFRCPIAHFEDADDPSKIRMYPFEEVYPNKKEEVCLEEVLLRKFYEECERKKEEAVKKNKAKELEEMKIAKQIQASIPANSKVLNMIKMDSSIADNTTLTVHTKEALNVVQDMWSSPASLHEPKPRQLFKSDSSEDLQKTVLAGNSQPVTPAPRKSTFTIYTEDEEAAPSATAQPSSTLRPPLTRSKIPLGNRFEEVLPGTEDGELAERVQRQVTLQQPSTWQIFQDKNDELSDETCNTKAFEFVLPSSTPLMNHKRITNSGSKVEESTDKLKKTQCENNTNLSVILEASKERFSTTDSNSSGSMHPRTSHSAKISDFECCSSPLNSAFSFPRTPNCRPSSVAPPSLQTIAEEPDDSSILFSSDVSPLNSPVGTSFLRNRTYTMKNDEFYDSDIHGASFSGFSFSKVGRSPLSARSKFIFKRKLKKAAFSQFEKENLSPGMMGFPSNSLVQQNCEDSITKRPKNRFSPSPSHLDKENLEFHSTNFKFHDVRKSEVVSELMGKTVTKIVENSIKDASVNSSHCAPHSAPPSCNKCLENELFTTKVSDFHSCSLKDVKASVMEETVGSKTSQRSSLRKDISVPRLSRTSQGKDSMDITCLNPSGSIVKEKKKSFRNIKKCPRKASGENLPEKQNNFYALSVGDTVHNKVVSDTSDIRENNQTSLKRAEGEPERDNSLNDPDLKKDDKRLLNKNEIATFLELIKDQNDIESEEKVEDTCKARSQTTLNRNEQEIKISTKQVNKSKGLDTKEYFLGKYKKHEVRNKSIDCITENRAQKSPKMSLRYMTRSRLSNFYICQKEHTEEAEKSSNHGNGKSKGTSEKSKEKRKKAGTEEDDVGNGICFSDAKNISSDKTKVRRNKKGLSRKKKVKCQKEYVSDKFENVIIIESDKREEGCEKEQLIKNSFNVKRVCKSKRLVESESVKNQIAKCEEENTIEPETVLKELSNKNIRKVICRRNRRNRKKEKDKDLSESLSDCSEEKPKEICAENKSKTEYKSIDNCENRDFLEKYSENISRIEVKGNAPNVEVLQYATSEGKPGKQIDGLREVTNYFNSVRRNKVEKVLIEDIETENILLKVTDKEDIFKKRNPGNEGRKEIIRDKSNQENGLFKYDDEYIYLGGSVEKLTRSRNDNSVGVLSEDVERESEAVNVKSVENTNSNKERYKSNIKKRSVITRASRVKLINKEVNKYIECDDDSANKCKKTVKNSHLSCATSEPENLEKTEVKTNDKLKRCRTKEKKKMLNTKIDAHITNKSYSLNSCEEPEDIKIRKEKKLKPRKRNLSVIRNKSISKKFYTVAEGYDPFNTKNIEELLEKINFPKAFQYDNYSVRNSLVPSMTRVVKVGDEPYTILGDLGKGSYARVLKASKGSDIVALKVEKPACKWEFYIANEIQRRAGISNLSSCFLNIRAAHIFNNGSILEIDYAKYGTIVDVITKYKTSAGKGLELGVVLHYAVELLDIVDCLHKCKIIHADLKPDNIVVKELPWYQEERPCLQLIDFGRCIDMSLFPTDIKFNCVFKTEDNKCNEMRDGRPWTYQIDLYGLASMLHCLIFGEYMKVQKRNNKWVLQKPIPRNMKRELWNPIFEGLLNVESCEAVPMSLAHFRSCLVAAFDESLNLSQQSIRFYRNVINS